MPTPKSPPKPPPPPPPRPSTAADDVPPQGTGTTGTPVTPPRETRAKDTGKQQQQRPPRKAPLQNQLEELFGAPALFFSFAEGPDSYPAQVIAHRTPLMAEAWYELAKTNAGIRRILERLVGGGAWGMVAISTAGVVVPILQHYGIIPGFDPFGTFLGEIPGQHGGPGATTGPIVPPPPTPTPTPQAATEGTPPVRDNGAAGMTRPLADSEPPGVVTVRGTGAVVQ